MAQSDNNRRSISDKTITQSFKARASQELSEIRVKSSQQQSQVEVKEPFFVE